MASSLNRALKPLENSTSRDVWGNSLEVTCPGGGYAHVLGALAGRGVGGFKFVGIGLVVWMAFFMLAPSTKGQAHRVAAAAPELREVGVPQFVIRGQNDIGLDLPPTDFKVMPDGRLLVSAPGALALGDGYRWDVYRMDGGGMQTPGRAVAVDRDGRIYTAMPEGFGVVELLENGRWRARLVAPWDEKAGVRMPALFSVIMAGEEWLWHGGSGPLVSWKPGREVKIVGNADSIEHAFLMDGAGYLSDRTAGGLRQMDRDGLEQAQVLPGASVNETVTCTVPFGKGQVLVGTYARGLWMFDGSTMKPFACGLPLETGARINALCEISGGLFAASVEDYGVIFFDRDGRVVQVLDKAVNHRLTHVRKLQVVAGGVVAGLLNDGILLVDFPSRVSHFEPLVGSGLMTAHPYRHEGKLWLLADGKVRRAVYDAGGRLSGFAVDSPGERFAFALSIAAGRLVAGTDRGSYYRGEDGWVLFSSTTTNLRVLDPKPTDGRWLYGALGEVGWMKPTASGFELEPTRVSGLGNLFNSETDADGSVWIETGNGSLGRLLNNEGRLTYKSYDSKDGIPPGWAQIFKMDGQAGFNFNTGILWFDPMSGRFRHDERFESRHPLLKNVYGRPVQDASGRIWFVSDGSVRVLDEVDGHWQNVAEPMPPGLEPYFFCVEDGGVVWMHREFRLARYDPAMPRAEPEPLGALITRVEFPMSGRSWFPNGNSIQELAADDNAVVVHFVATGGMFASAVVFEVKLEGADDQWVEVGSSGTASFHRMKEGRYVLHVRPRAAGVIGTEARVEFQVQPPWYRTRVAYLLYALAAVGLVVVVGRVSSFLQRRENARLERLVAQRTSELVDSHRKLENQVEEIRRLSQAVEQSPNGVALATPDGTIAFANPRFCAIYGRGWPELRGSNLRSLSAEPPGSDIEGEIAAAMEKGGAWHGELTNRTKDGRSIRVRVNISAIRSPDGIVKHHLVLHEDITEWLAEQERRRRLESQLLQAQKLDALGTLAGGIAHDFNNILTGILGFCELAKLSAGNNFELQDRLEEITKAGLRAKELVARILTFSRQGHTQLQPLDLAPVVLEAVKLLRASTPATIELETSLQPGVIRADATQIQQIVINLGTNAVHAIGARRGRVLISLQPVRIEAEIAAEMRDLAPGEWIKLTVSDNGHGMDRATVDRVFEPFFTTKKPGEGTGLGLAIVRAILTSHHGAVRINSEQGRGTDFELFFPRCNETPVTSPEAASHAKAGSLEVLVVDDEVSVGKFVAVYLNKLGYRPEVHTDPRAALDAFQRAPERFGAIVTDLTMPFLTGAELLEKIRQIKAQIPAVIISGYSEDLMRLRSETTVHCAVLQKPFTGQDLGRALDQVIRSDFDSHRRA